MQISANLYGIEIKLRNSQAVLILVIYCLIDYLVLANILSAMLCSNFAKRAHEVIEAPGVKRENADHLRAKPAENLTLTALRLA